MSKIKAVFINRGHGPQGRDVLDYVYGSGRREQVCQMTDMYPEVIHEENFDEHADKLADREVVFSTWGMPKFDDEQLDRMPNLKAVFYAAGSVKGFAPPFLRRGIIVSSAWAANAVSVAEFCLAQILLASKGYFRNTRDYQSCEDRKKHRLFRGRGAYGEKVALIGAGQIGRKLIELLRPYRLIVQVVDPYLSQAEAEELGVQKISMEEAFSDAYVVSNHLPNLPDLQNVLNGEHFASMRQGATFINTGRGAQVDEPAMIEVLKKRPDLLALLDVTKPEPPEPDSPLYELPNVQLSGHLAGAHDDEVLRMADTAIEEFKRWENGEPLQYSVTLEMLERMA